LAMSGAARVGGDGSGGGHRREQRVFQRYARPPAMVGSGLPDARRVGLEDGGQASRPRAGPVRRLEQWAGERTRSRARPACAAALRHGAAAFLLGHGVRRRSALRRPPVVGRRAAVQRLVGDRRRVVGSRVGGGCRTRRARVGRYFARLNWNGIWVNCFTFRPPTSAGRNRMAGSAFITVAVNKSCVDLRTLNVLMSATPLVSTTNWASTSPSTFALRSMSG